MTPNAETERLRKAMMRCLSLAAPWSGDLFRFAAPRWATVRHLLTGVGALSAGGRWHPIGICPAVYASLDPETALAESLATQRRYQWADRDAMPRTLNAVACRFQRILNLTMGGVRQRLGVSADRMLQEPWWERQEHDEEALTQAMGRIAWELWLEGLLVPSAARHDGLNLVFFPDHKDPASVLEIIHPEELPDQVP